jgi:thiol-disulfide isomerase/thioredoxin
MPELDSLNGYSLVFFTGSWCKPCKILLDSLLTFHKLHPETTIISVNNETDSAAFLRYLNTYQVPWKVILDMQSIPTLSEMTASAWKQIFNKETTTEPLSYCDVYDIEAYPTLFLINPQRKILHVTVGHTSGIELLKKIDAFGHSSFED